MIGFLKKMFGNDQTDFKALTDKGALIVDVRSAAEFASGHIPGSRNIPVNIIKRQLAELKNYGKPIITVCQSGTRSGMAQSMLSNSGIEAYNGGPWFSLQKKLSN